MTLSETRYAKSGELRIGYEVVGSGPFDLVFVNGGRQTRLRPVRAIPIQR